MALRASKPRRILGPASDAVRDYGGPVEIELDSGVSEAEMGISTRTEAALMRAVSHVGHAEMNVLMHEYEIPIADNPGNLLKRGHTFIVNVTVNDVPNGRSAFTSEITRWKALRVRDFDDLGIDIPQSLSGYGAWRSPVAHLRWEPAGDPLGFTEIVEPRGFSHVRRPSSMPTLAAIVNVNMHTYVHMRASYALPFAAQRRQLRCYGSPPTRSRHSRPRLVEGGESRES